MHTVPETKSKGIILIHGGNDSYFEEFLFAILYLREMGFEVYMFEGPGQGGVMRVQGMHFTHEWEKPVKAVLDYFGLDDVTIIGISLGGYLAPRAAAFDKRIKRVAAWSVFPCFQDVIVGMQKPDCGAGGRADVADERENVSAPYLQSVQPVATRKENAVRRLPLGFKIIIVFSPIFSSGAGIYSLLCGPISQKRPRLKPFTNAQPLPKPSVSRNVSQGSSTFSVNL